MAGRFSVDLGELRVFAEVAASGNMSVAAKRLAMTQPAVSQTVRRLEAGLGVALFFRDRRPLALTMAGNLLRGRADIMIREAIQLPSILRDAGTAPAPEIRIGLVDTFASTAGPQMVRALTGEASRVVVWSGLSTTLGSALLDRDVDLIVTSDMLDDSDEIRRFILWREPFILLMPKVKNACLVETNLAHLAATMPLIRFSGRSHIGIQIERQLRRLGIRAERRIEIDGSDALVAMVAAGVGWAIATPLCLLQGAAHASGVTVAPLSGPQARRSLSLLSRRHEFPELARRIASMSIDALQTVCLPRIRRMAPWLQHEIIVGSNNQNRRS